ncbi:uncharacterized protein LTR77_010976 [Saxophila tyrrhenica]|uniref:Uncharacterized protein n=1 Tax=Saxophila tyrrhenica TaxID=1690608 RepID=A0AAV9NTU7_9PEZI|nr:hypothetical protein LTR77_010976 [Saxophila tyrrhenica]
MSGIASTIEREDAIMEVPCPNIIEGPTPHRLMGAMESNGHQPHSSSNAPSLAEWGGEHDDLAFREVQVAVPCTLDGLTGRRCVGPKDDRMSSSSTVEDWTTFEMPGSIGTGDNGRNEAMAQDSDSGDDENELEEPERLFGTTAVEPEPIVRGCFFAMCVQDWCTTTFMIQFSNGVVPSAFAPTVDTYENAIAITLCSTCAAKHKMPSSFEQTKFETELGSFLTKRISATLGKISDVRWVAERIVGAPVSLIKSGDRLRFIPRGDIMSHTTTWDSVRSVDLLVAKTGERYRMLFDFLLGGTI